MENMNRFNNRGKEVCSIIMILALVLFYYSDYKCIYAVFKYAPVTWTEYFIQSIALCAVHLLVTGIVLMSFLSVNASMWSCGRVVAFTLSAERTYIKAYRVCYLFALLITVLLEIYMLKKGRGTKPSKSEVLRSGSITMIGTIYFIILSCVPLYARINGSALWAAAYFHDYFRLLITAAMIIAAALRLIHHLKSTMHISCFLQGQVT